ncbi:MAG: HNH endonuclease [Deltaproteobacteria bacterium]|nr:HNH endonuclease [Deltaproteobacteria bacterium]
MEVLVLGQSYEPLERVGWKRAMVWWAAGRVEILEAWEGRTIRTPRTELPMPSVVRFLRSRRRHGAPTIRFSRDSVFARDRGACQYCGKEVPRRDGTYDHITPKSRGGQTLWENIVLACRPCNQRKGNRTPSEAGMHLRVAPQRPSFAAIGTWQVLVGFGDTLPRAWRPYLGLDV